MGTTLREPPDAGHAGQRWTMNGSSFGALAYADTRVVWRDPLLKWVLLLPIGLALLLRVLIPKAQAALLVSAGFEAAPYYPLVMGGYLMTAPGIVGMVVGFLLLDEQDARTLTALRVTPLSMRRYLAYRVTVPLLRRDGIDSGGLSADRSHAAGARPVGRDLGRRRLVSAAPCARVGDRGTQQGRRIRHREGAQRSESAAHRCVLCSAAASVRGGHHPGVLAHARLLVSG